MIEPTQSFFKVQLLPDNLESKVKISLKHRQKKLRIRDKMHEVQL